MARVCRREGNCFLEEKNRSVMVGVRRRCVCGLDYLFRHGLLVAKQLD